MWSQKVKEYFAAVEMGDRVMKFTESSATVELTAKAAGCESARIAKSLVLPAGESPSWSMSAWDGNKRKAMGYAMALRVSSLCSSRGLRQYAPFAKQSVRSSLIEQGLPCLTSKPA